MAFDFSQFCGGEAKRPVEFLGLTSVQTKEILEREFGLSKTLMQQYPEVTKRGDAPNAVTKALIVFEANGRDTTYEEIGQACGISVDTAYQQMSKARKWIQEGFKLRIEHSGERVYLVTNETLALKAERLDAHIQKVEKVMENLLSDVNSIRQSGQVVQLPGKAAAVISGYESAKRLEAAPEVA